ncbi:ATP-dependent zinc metalloprotease FtsH [Mariniblastus sp.]|nr:ATP-dependent zinc metalloprotease FtsH [Mariniblastus sp.]MDB4756135.1 ATP-dependent zinc metalloprotease FtsH [Mariniblastus sp.]
MESKKKEQVGPKSGSEGSSEDGSPRSSGNLYMLLFFIFGSLLIFYYFNGYQPVTISESFFSKQIRGEEYDGTPIQENGEEIACNIAEITFREYGAEGKFRVRPLQPVTKSSSEKTEGNPTRYKLEFFVGLEKSGASDNRANYKEELIKLGVDVKTDSTPNNAMNYLMIIALLIPVALLMYFWYASRRAQDQMLGGGGFLSSFSRSPAQRVNDDSESISFDDVAGLEGVKADLQEIVDYLKDPAKFQKLGGRVPKGVLLNGSPGTGKTLLARAVAGEADVPFYSVNGSEFIQMFVGVGASRVRDLFKQAKETSPAIIFIDEIDAVGRQRGAGLGGGHDEREQTLNQILGEMDGFAQNDSVIVVAATNRADVLDPALLRPGRFDRHIAVNRPTKNGRLEIFKVHVREVPLAEDVDLMQLAVGCIGMTGADIRNVVNEAALWAARQNKNRVEREDFGYAMDKIRMGSKREEILSDEEKEKTAYHEAGHTITGWFLEGADPVQKVSVIPRGQALGLTMSVPEEDRVSYTEDELRDRLVVYMGGRAAEKVVYDERLVGAQNDIERATHIARRMVTDWGMSQKIGPVSFKTGDDDPFLGREMHQQRNFSEHTMEIIDEEVSEIIRDAMERAISMLTENRDKLDALTKSLIEHEELEAEGIEKVLGPSVHQKKEQWASKLIVDTAEDSVSSDSQNGQEKTSPIAEEAN